MNVINAPSRTVCCRLFGSISEPIHAVIRMLVPLVISDSPIDPRCDAIFALTAVHFHIHAHIPVALVDLHEKMLWSLTAKCITGLHQHQQLLTHRQLQLQYPMRQHHRHYRAASRLIHHHHHHATTQSEHPRQPRHHHG